MWLAIAALVLAGCASTGSAGNSTTSARPADVTDRAAETVAATVEPEPTGVPGLTAADPFCAAWAAYVGTLQALGIAGSFGELSSEQFAALELVSATRVVEVAAAIEAAWPAELAGEREVVLEQRIGPYVRRATRAVAALTDAGVTTAELSTLSAAWQAALSTRDPAVPVIQVPTIAADLQAKVDAAASAYDAAVTPFAHDPSLSVDDVLTPSTDAYLVAHCPDLAASGVGDAI